MDIARRLPLPVPFSDHTIVAYRATVAEATAILGEPAGQDFIDGLGPASYWAYEFGCGLQILVIAYEANPIVQVCADLPEPNHLIRHLDLNVPVLYTIDDQPEDALDACYSRYRHEAWDSSARWRVRRQDDNGHQFVVGVFNSQREAQCIARHMESLGHKQTYWIESIAQTPPTS